jgi:hypothetical protein
MTGMRAKDPGAACTVHVLVQQVAEQCANPQQVLPCSSVVVSCFPSLTSYLEVSLEAVWMKTKFFSGELKSMASRASRGILALLNC